MSEKLKKSMPVGTPMLNVRGAARALEFYRNAFEALELTRMTNDDGSVAHAEIKIGGTVIMVAEEWPKMAEMGWARSPADLGGSSVILLVYVPDVDNLFSRALGFGAKGITPPEDQPFGRRCRLADPFGHLWMMATPKSAVPGK
jgi:PhnB protein